LIAGRTILHSISFEARPGEFIGLLGVNGAGKSTLLDILAGLRAPSHGEVHVKDFPLTRISPAKRARWICHLPQGVRAGLTFSVEQIVLMGRYPLADTWLESQEDQASVVDALTRTHALDFRHRSFSTLSGGERQRVLLAACLAQQASILLMDEPSTYLDLRHQIQCFELLREEAARGAVCIAVTHDLNLALAYCSRILVLQDGELERDMSVAEAWRQQAWLAHFSERLRIERSHEGAPWIAYR
jgi:iron complex transport system ATP-binding protein